LAIDLESNSLFSYREEVCLIQVSTSEKDYIVDPIAGIDLYELGLIIQDPAVEKVFHAAEYDCILLKNQYGWKLENLFDTMWAGRILAYERYSLANMLENAYGVKLNKKFQKANWCKRPLTDAQLIYAQMDTHYLLRLRDDLSAELKAEGCLDEAQEIFAEQTDVRPSNRVFDPHGFWSISGVKELAPKSQAVVRALYLFRDEQARRQNRPHFKIFGDQTIIELARKLPSHLSQLEGIHGMSRGQIGRYGRPLLKIIQRAQNDPAPQKPKRKSRRPNEMVSSRYDRLHLWRKERARARGVESDVIVSRDALWELARENPSCPADLTSINNLGPWRQETYGEEIIEVLSSV
jgi:ribonuclease D